MIKIIWSCFKMYENLKPNKMNEAINKLGKKTTVYFIGFCVFFVMSFFYSVTIHTFFTVLIGFLFMGFLMLYYMIGYTFIRIIKMFQDNSLDNLVNSYKEISDKNLEENNIKVEEEMMDV